MKPLVLPNVASVRWGEGPNRPPRPGKKREIWGLPSTAHVDFDVAVLGREHSKEAQTSIMYVYSIIYIYIYTYMYNIIDIYIYIYT